MSAKVHLTLCCYAYDRTRPLIDGQVQIDGVDLTCLTTIGQPERQWRMTRYQQFDLCEYSLSSYLAGRTLGSLPLVAVPVFPLRRFRHNNIYVNVGKGIRAARDLAGKKVGLRSWQVTAALWARGILGSEYGLDLRSVDWYTHDAEDVELAPPGFRITRLPEGTDMDRMFAEGELDALIYPKSPTSFILGDPRVARLFPDYKSEEIRYYRKTRIFPIMHVLAFREDVVQRHPWVPQEVSKGFERAKAYALQKLDDTRELTAAWVGEEIELERGIFGRDPMPYGFSANRHVLEQAVEYALDQGTISRRPDWEELFYPPSLDESAHGYASPML